MNKMKKQKGAREKIKVTIGKLRFFIYVILRPGVIFIFCTFPMPFKVTQSSCMEDVKLLSKPL